MLCDKVMELPARALCALLEDDPLQYPGQVLSVREYLGRKGIANSTYE
jgi:hypothetical protein